MNSLETYDPELFQHIRSEVGRQQSTLELIPSENTVSKPVLEATGTILTTKYAEGYPGRRYYGGCEFVDKVEQLAIDRAKALFGADHANVQPHSGTQANMGVYLGFLNPGDKILGMDLSHGGHLTHGAKVNFSGMIYEGITYGVRKDDQRIDFDEVRKLAKEHRPKMIVAGASAYPRIIDFETFASIAKEIDALFMVDMAHIAGLVAVGLHPSPVACADFVTSTTHKTLRGPRGGIILCKEAYRKKVNSRICPGIQGGPLLHVIAAKAVAFKQAMEPDFKTYQQQVLNNAVALAETLLEEGFNLVSGGTENHLLLVDLRNKDITGKEAEARLDLAGITLNKNTVPFETQPPLVTSGIRMGTPAITSRGMKEAEMQWLGKTISRVIASSDEAELKKIRSEVGELCKQFPIYNDI